MQVFAPGYTPMTPPESIDTPEFSTEPPVEAPVGTDAPSDAPAAAEGVSLALRDDGDAMSLAVAEVPTIPSQAEFLSLAMQARVFASSGLVPRTLQGKPADVLLVLMTGRDLGIAPTAALRKCYVVDGQVTIAPALKLALVKLHGLGSIRPGPENDDTSATAIAYDPHGRELGRCTVTMEDAKRITYGRNNAKLVEKDNWKSYPARMLWWRAAGYLVDDLFPEVAFGLYSPDEIGAVTDEEGHVIDVESVDMPDGFDEAKRRDKFSAEQVDEFKRRANALSGRARSALRKMLHERGLPTDATQIPAGASAVVFPMLSAVEANEAKGKYADEPTADGEPTAEERDCPCAPGGHEFGCEHYTYASTEEPVDAVLVEATVSDEEGCENCWAPHGTPHNAECELVNSDAFQA